MEIFAKRLKELRQEKGLSQFAVAQSICIAQQSYSPYELNKTEPSLEVLARIAKFFGVESDYLIGLKDY